MSQIKELKDQPPDSGTSTSAVVQEKAVGEEVLVAADVPIPWRTSRRLQEATLKSLQERESGFKPNTSIAKKEKETSSPVSSTWSRALKRHHSPPGTAAATEQKEVCGKRKNLAPLLSSGRKKRRRVHFGNPLFIHIEEKKQQYPSSSKSSATSTASSKKFHNAQSSLGSHSRDAGVQQQRQKQPLSCFDLFCNHVGPRGWRCYRVCSEGESFCSNHMNRATSLPRISVCT